MISVDIVNSKVINQYANSIDLKLQAISYCVLINSLLPVLKSS